MEISELWTNTLQLLEPEISPISFKTWIEPIVPVKISGNTVVLRIDESFIKSMVETRFLSLIENTVKHVGGADYKINIISGEESAEEEKRTEEKGIERLKRKKAGRRGNRSKGGKYEKKGRDRSLLKFYTLGKRKKLCHPQQFD